MSKGRSTLRSFAFGSYKGVDELPSEVLNLFTSLLERPDKHIEFASEIIDAGLEGRINFNTVFNLSAYEFTCKSNERMNLERRRAKEVFIDYSSTDTEREESLRNGGITIDSVSISAVDKLADAFEEVIDNSELEYAVSTIKALNNDFIVDYNVNLISVIKRAKDGFPQAKAVLKRLCDECDVVKEQVEIILRSGRDVNSCFA